MVWGAFAQHWCIPAALTGSPETYGAAEIRPAGLDLNGVHCAVEHSYRIDDGAWGYRRHQLGSGSGSATLPLKSAPCVKLAICTTVVVALFGRYMPILGRF